MTAKPRLEIKLSGEFPKIPFPLNFSEYRVYTPEDPHYAQHIQRVLDKYHEKILLMRHKNWTPPEAIYSGVFFRGDETSCFFQLLSGNLHEVDFKDIRRLWVPVESNSGHYIEVPDPNSQRVQRII